MVSAPAGPADSEAGSVQRSAVRAVVRLDDVCACCGRYESQAVSTRDRYLLGILLAALGLNPKAAGQVSCDHTIGFTAACNRIGSARPTNRLVPLTRVAWAACGLRQFDWRRDERPMPPAWLLLSVGAFRLWFYRGKLVQPKNGP